MKRKLKKLLLKLEPRVKHLVQSLHLSAAAVGLVIIAFITPFLHNQFLLNKVGSNTVKITNFEMNSGGTGFEVKTPSGKVLTLTNAHICELGENGMLMLHDRHNGRPVPRRILEIWDKNDLCLVEGLEGYDGLSLANGVDIGDQNWVIGFPLLEPMNMSYGFIKGSIPIRLLEENTSVEDCHKLGQEVYQMNTFFGSIKVCTIVRQTTATSIPIWPGNSGSPMVNAFGNLTGVIFAGNNQTFWGHAVPLADVKEFLRAY